MEKKFTKEFIMTVLFLVLTFSTFFMKGMFFEGEQFLYLALLGILSAIIFFFIPMKQKLGKSLDFFVIGIVVVYIIASFTALYLRNSVLEVIKYSGCLLVYFISKELLAKNKTLVLSVLYFSGVLMSLIGLGAASELYYISGSYDTNKNLVMSLFQYHNTSALLLSVVFIFGLSLYQKTERLWIKLCLHAGNMIALLTVLFSESRGTWLIFPFALFLYFLLLPKGKRAVSLPLFGTFLSAGIIMRGMGTALADRNTVFCIIFIIVSVLLALLFGFILEKLLPKINFNKKTGIIIAAIVMVALIILILFGKYVLPQSIYHRVSTFNMQSRTVTERLTFYKNAFSIFKDYPILGIGGGGWPYLYGQYQSYRYLANSPHSFLLSLMVECGFLGILIFVYLILALLILLKKLFRSDSEQKEKFAPYYVAVVFIFLHSMIDIDFSYYTIGTMTWLMLGILSDIEVSKQSNNKLIKWGFILISVVIAICGFTGKTAWNRYYKTAEYMASDPKTAYSHASKAVSLDPGNSMYAITKGNIEFHLAAAQKDETNLRYYADLAKATFEKAYQNNPGDHILTKELSTFYVNTGRFDDACKMSENLLKLQPLDKNSYLHVAEIYTTAAQIYQKNGDIPGIKKTMGRLATLWDEQKEICAKKNWSFEMNRATKDAILQAIRIMEQIDALEEKK